MSKLLTIALNPDGSQRISIIDKRGERVLEADHEVAWLAQQLRRRLVTAPSSGVSVTDNLEFLIRTVDEARTAATNVVALLEPLAKELKSNRQAIEALSAEVARQNLDRESIKAWIKDGLRNEHWVAEAKGGQ